MLNEFFNYKASVTQRCHPPTSGCDTIDYEKGGNQNRRGKVRNSYQYGIGLADGPKIDLVIFSTGDKNPGGLPPNLQTVDSGRVCYKFLCSKSEVKEFLSEQKIQNNKCREARKQISRSECLKYKTQIKKRHRNVETKTLEIEHKIIEKDT